MKNRIPLLLIGLSLFSNISLSAQNCPTEWFKTQDDIDNFAISYPTCKKLTISLVIREGSNIQNLNGLSQLTSINGAISIIDNKLLQNLQGLENVTSVSESIAIWRNENLIPINK